MRSVSLRDKVKPPAGCRFGVPQALSLPRTTALPGASVRSVATKTASDRAISWEDCGFVDFNLPGLGVATAGARSFLAHSAGEDTGASSDSRLARARSSLKTRMGTRSNRPI